uniref:tRNA methyltransferase 10 homolog B isoform X3 n=1 Tax=Solea senegalensis TaxID=28829 RepID=UPI001CD8E0B6|nr:tRNA methyltransferase 10 homolog B isoform X3 [Solea senegalensis]
MNATGSRFCLWYSRVISSYFILLYTFICRFQFVIENTECPGNVCETSRHERSRQMAHIPSAECDMQLNGVSEEMDLLHIQVEADVVEEKPGREDALCSEISRLAGQLRRVYGSNKKAARPFHLFLTDLREDSRLYRECIRKNDGFLSYMSKKLEQASVRGSQGVNRMIVRWKSQMKVFWTFSRQKLLSTSPQTPNKVRRFWIHFTDESVVLTLETMDAEKVYVLGGLVDESIQKKLSFTRASELSVHTVRLPIDEYMVKKSNAKNFHSKILAVNQVFDILLTFCDTGSWTEALQAWFPQGKGYVVAPDDSSSQKLF